MLSPLLVVLVGCAVYVAAQDSTTQMPTDLPTTDVTTATTVLSSTTAISMSTTVDETRSTSTRPSSTTPTPPKPPNVVRVSKAPPCVSRACTIRRPVEKSCTWMETDSEQCHMHKEDHGEYVDKCPMGLLRYDAQPYFYRNGYHLDTAKLNMTFQLYAPAAFVAFTFECQTASDRNANLCHNKLAKLDHWAKPYSPCRSFHLFDGVVQKNSTWSTSYASMFYDCFHMESKSHYRITATVGAPYMCQNTYDMYMESIEKVVPHLVRQKNVILTRENPFLDWVPLLTVDYNDPHGVWFSLSHAPAESSVKYITVSLHDSLTSALVRQIFVHPPEDEAIDVELPQDAHKDGCASSFVMRDIPAGNYTVYISVTLAHCQGSCPQFTQTISVPEDKWNAETTRNSHLLNTLSWATFGVILIVLLAIVLIYLTYKWFTKRAVHLRLLEPVEMSVVYRPKCLIIYTDDNLAHRDCVEALATWLRDYCGCDILLDMWTFGAASITSTASNGGVDNPYQTTTHSDAAQTPLQWWMNALETADRYIVVFSEGTQLAWSGRHLRRAPDRHWENMFPAVITMVLNEIFSSCRANMSDSTLPKYVWTQFCDTSATSPSSCIEHTFTRLPCARCDLPLHARQLYCAMHDGVTNKTLHPHHQLHNGALVDTIAHMHLWRRATPNWYADMIDRVADETTTISEMPEFETRSAKTTAGVGVREAYEMLQRLQAPLTVDADNDTVVTEMSHHSRLQHYTVIPPSEDTPTVTNGHANHKSDDRFELIGCPDDHDD